MNGRAVLAIARKDIGDAIKNRYLLFSLILPIGMSLLMQLLFPSQTRAEILQVAVYDPGGSRLVQLLQKYPRVEIDTVKSEDEMIKAASSAAIAGISIPDGFDAAVLAGQIPELYVYQNQKTDPSILSYFQRITEQEVWQLAGIDFPASIHWDGAPLGDAGGTSGITSKSGVQSSFQVDRYIFVLMLVMSLAMTGSFIVPYLLVEEKEKHTLEALLLSPTGPLEVVAGKALTGLFYSFLIAAILIGLNQGWQGTWPVTVLAILLGSLFIIAVGLILGSAFNNIHQVNTWSSIIMIALMIPSWLGPISMPSYLEAIFRLVPTYYMSGSITRSLSGQATLANSWGDLSILAGSMLVAGAFVVWIMNRKARA
jgi:ABC-2 type transport system permease protein